MCIIIFGVIDWCSRLAVLLECINNNQATTVLPYFLKVVETYVIPSRVRSEKGRENVLVTDCMIEKHFPEKGSMIAEPKTHNQRIERLWRDVFDRVFAL